MERSLEQSVADSAYLDFFGLTRPPFARLADPSQFFQTEQYSFLMEHLDNAMKRADCLVAVCGARGAGKSTLLNHYIRSLGNQITFVAVDETCHGEEQFYCEFLTQIGFSDISGTADELRNITREFLVYRGNAGDPVLVIVDNAHRIEPIILEQVRRLAEIKTNERRVISIVLAGNPDLVRVLDSPAMSQTKFESHVVFNIRAYTEEETANYVWHRLRYAGGNEGIKFAHAAHPLIHRYSGGIPQLINRLCNDLLAEAHSLKSRVISDQIVRAVANKKRLLPFVIPLHGRGRRCTDPDVSDAEVVPQSKERIAKGKAKPKKPLKPAAPATADADPKNLLQRIAALSEEIEDLRADKLRALHEVDARNKDINELRNELESKTSEIEALGRSLDTDSDEFTQQQQALSDSVEALQASEAASNELADKLQQEETARKATEKELASATGTVESLGEQNQELQARVGDLESGLKAAEERAAELEAIEQSSTELPNLVVAGSDELESLQAELELRNKAFSELEAQLRESKQAVEAAEQKILDLENPQKLQDAVKIADERAAELQKETRAREAAESQLAEATASIEELTRQKDAFEATVGDLEARLDAEGKAASEQAADFETLETSKAELTVEMQEQAAALASLQAELDSRNEILADLEQRYAKSQSATELAQQRLLELKSPKELRKIEKASKKLAKDLEKETTARNAAEDELAQAAAAIEELRQLKEDMQTTVSVVRADLESEHRVAGERAGDIESLKKKTASLEKQSAELEKQSATLETEIEEKSAELESLEAELESRDQAVAELETRLDASEKECASTHVRIAALKTPEQLQAVQETADTLAAELESEAKARGAAEEELAQTAATVEELRQLNDEMQATVSGLQADLDAGQKAAEKELAEATATAEELRQLKDEMQATVSELQADLDTRTKAADQRAREIEELNKATADLKDEVDKKSSELDSLRDELRSRNEALAELESRLDASEKDYTSAQERMAALKDPQELHEVEEAANKFAANLEEEARARQAAEQELAEARASVDSLGQQNEELQAAIRDLNADLERSGERAVNFAVLEETVSTLKDEIEKKTSELQTRDQTLADLEDQLEATRSESILRERFVSESSDDEDEETEFEDAATVSANDARAHSSVVVQRFEESISNSRAYRTLRQYDPAFYFSLIATYRRLVGLDRTDKQINDALRAEQAELIEKLLPKASDDSIIAYAQLIVEQLTEFKLDGAEPCFTLLIPQSNRGIHASPVFSEGTRELELAVLDITLKTHDEDRPIPTEDDVWADLEPIFLELFKAYGEENVSAVLNSDDRGANGGIDRDLLCDINRSLYAGILKLPKHKAVKAFRWILSP